MAGVLQADVLPGFAAVGGFVNPVTMGYIQADGGFAHASINYVGVRRSHVQRPDRGRLQKAIGHILPGQARIGGFPDAAGGDRDVVAGAVGGFDGEVADVWAAEAGVALFDSPTEEISRLEPIEIIGGYYHRVGVAWKQGTTLQP